MFKPAQVRRLVITGMFVLLVAPWLSTSAATLYVSKNGSDGNPGTKAEPLLKIQDAIDASKTNGKIIVGPGKYVENLVIDNNSTGDPLSGLKLESSAGRWATIIDGNGLALHVIDVRRPKVQIGRKGKGFTIQNSVGLSPYAGLNYLNVFHGGKIEGNWFVNHYTGLSVTMFTGAKRIQIRSNVFSDNVNYGLRCFNCDSAIIRENHAQGNITGIQIVATGSARVEKNVLMNNDAYGIHNLQSDGKNRIKDNVLVGNALNGYNQFDGDGDIVQANIAAQNGTGFNSSQSTDTNIQQVKNNLSVANGTDGFFLGTGPAQKFQFNTAISNADDGVQTGSNTDFASFTNNNAIDNDCGIEVETGETVLYSKQFFANNTASISCGGGTIDLNSTTVNKPNPLKASIAGKL